MPYLYAVTEAPDGGLEALAGDPPRSLWEHEEVVERAMEQATVLPMRFGSAVDDVDAFLAERHDELAAALERVRGAVELGVRPHPAEAASGTEYLLRRAAAERVQPALAELSRASVRLGRACAYLVDRDLVEAFRARAAALPDPVVVTGPWPPYSFV